MMISNIDILAHLHPPKKSQCILPPAAGFTHLQLMEGSRKDPPLPQHQPREAKLLKASPPHRRLLSIGFPSGGIPKTSWGLPISQAQTVDLTFEDGSISPKSRLKCVVRCLETNTNGGLSARHVELGHKIVPRFQDSMYGRSHTEKKKISTDLLLSKPEVFGFWVLRSHFKCWGHYIISPDFACPGTSVKNWCIQPRMGWFILRISNTCGPRGLKFQVITQRRFGKRRISLLKITC